MNRSFRLFAAAALGAITIFGVPRFANKAVPIDVVAPDADMLAKTDAVQRVMRAAKAGDRMVWAELWRKAGSVAAGDETATEVIFTDTRALRGYTAIALEIGWRRIGGVEAGRYDGLREAVEKAFAETIGMEIKPVTPEIRARYVSLCKAIAWAGINRG